MKKLNLKKFDVWQKIFHLVNKFLIFLLTTYSLYGAFKDSGWGARAAGMGGAFSAVANDASAPLWNPSGVAQIKRPKGIFMYSQLFVGLEEVNLALHYASFVYPTKNKVTIGISWANFTAMDTYRENTVVLCCATKITEFIPYTLPDIFLGVNLKYLDHGFTLDKRTYDDPVFLKGTSKGAITVDIGFLMKIRNESFALSIKNITEPDVGLKTKDIVPKEVKFGISYRFGRFWQLYSTLCAFDLTYRDEDLNLHFGIESWFYKRLFAIRIGINNREVTSGFAFNFNLLNKIDLQLDYAFIWPMYIEESYGSHRISLSYRF